MNQTKVKEIITNNFVGSYSKDKVNAVAKVASKFINAHTYDEWQSVYSPLDMIDACLQMYSVEKDLSTYLERNIQIWIKK